jgi:hypothetical protein
MTPNGPMISVFLGAGFSSLGGVPLASQIFDSCPEVDRITRQHLVERVVSNWEIWKQSHGGAPEEYLTYLQRKDAREWRDALWFVGLRIALEMGKVERVGMKMTITRHNIDRTTGVPAHEAFWSVLFRRTQRVCVITTNYDILAEKGLRHEPRPRAHRFGFHYGDGPESLAGGGYPSYAHIQKIKVSGDIPLLKLHGSVSWSFRQGEVIRYHDCRPAIRGDAAIVAPVTEKSVPDYLRSIWSKTADMLSLSDTWIVVGYSIPAYDLAVRELLSKSAKDRVRVHVFNPNQKVADEFTRLIPSAIVSSHPGLPEGIADLERVLDEQRFGVA